jgi:hypothetical protein
MCVRTDTVYRGDITLLRHVVKIIIHASAIYLHAFPHRQYPPISQYSVDVVRPILYHDDGNDDHEDDEGDDDDDDDDEGGDDDNNVDDNDDDDDVIMNNEDDRHGEWDHVDTGYKFSAFQYDDLVMAWFDDNFYEGRIIEVDGAREMFTIQFILDNVETDSYKACWLKHMPQ